MTSRELVKNALTFKECPRTPIDIHDTYGPDYTYGLGRISGVPYAAKGVRLDNWGCEWIAAEDGVAGEVKNPLIKERKDLKNFTPPFDVLDEADLSKVNICCKNSDKFMMPCWGADYNLFERMQWLRGTEQLYVDMALEDPIFFELLEVCHDYYIRQAKLWAKTDIDGMFIADDWGTQNSLLISPVKWREYFKPLYKEYCDIAHASGKLVMMHSDGYTRDIFDDLSEIGVNAVNSQLFCMNIEEIADKYHHKLAFWGEIDRQNILPFKTSTECRAAVHRVADAFYKYGHTGIVAQCYGGKGIPEDNVKAVYDEWEKIIW